MLARCYRSVLSLAVKKGIKTIAFPSISTGAYGFPVAIASKIAVAEIRKFLEADNSIMKVIIACFNQDVFDAYSDALK
jgi:O-acetyl-ADP-ribose deacetylase (regulator of RNase III)